MTIDTEYISRASHHTRALGAMTLVKRASASEVAVISGAIQGTWIDGYGIECWMATGWILFGFVVCGILVSMVLLWRKSGRVTEMVDDETQTLEDGRRDQNVPMRVMITKDAHCRDDCPFLLKSHSIQSLSWCSHCDPSDAYLEAAEQVLNLRVKF